MIYTISFNYTINQDVWIKPFSTKGEIREVALTSRGIIYDVRYFQGMSVAFAYLYEKELEKYTGQDDLIND